jgi:hypothetical protein
MRRARRNRGGTGPPKRRLVDVKLVSFGIGHRDRVVVQALLDVRMQSRCTEGHEPRCNASAQKCASSSGDVQSITSWYDTAI